MWLRRFNRRLRSASARPGSTSSRATLRRAAVETLEQRRLLASVSGTVFDDVNGNGERDAGEAGLSGWQITVRNESGSDIATAATDGDGHYAITDLPDFEPLTVRIEGRSNWQPSTHAEWSAGWGDQTIHFGQTQNILISGFVWDDTDADGWWETWEDWRIGDQTIYIDLDEDGQLDAGEPFDITTPGTGQFQIGGLPGGSYLLRHLTTPGVYETTSHQRLVVADLAHETDVAFGAAYAASVSGRIFNDVQADTDRDETDPALSGWTIFLDEDNDRVLDAGEPSALSDAEGNYQIADVVPGGHVLRAVMPSGWQQTTAQNSIFATSGSWTAASDLGVSTTSPSIPSYIDPSFGNNGQVRSSIQYFQPGIEPLALPDGRTFVVDILGRWAFYGPDGAPDPSLGGDSQIGYINEQFFVMESLLQPDGKVLLVGSAMNAIPPLPHEPWTFRMDPAVIRLNPDGSLDTSFGGGDGMAVVDALAVLPRDEFLWSNFSFGHDAVLQADGKIVLGGDIGFGPALMRLNSDGTPDVSWGPEGIKRLGPNYSGLVTSLIADSQGRLVSQIHPYDQSDPAGSIQIVRHDAQGQLDTAFGTDGVINLDGMASVEALAATADGGFLVGSTHNESWDAPPTYRLRRYLGDGSLDTGFASGGVEFDWIHTNSPPVFLVQGDGKVIFSAPRSDEQFHGNVVLRLNADGSMDGTFGTGGQIELTAPAEEYLFQSHLLLRDTGRLTHIGTSHAALSLTQIVAYEPPTVQVGTHGLPQFRRGSTANFWFDASDPDSLDGLFTYAIDWNGDGVVDEILTGPSKIKLQHVYEQTGDYAVTVRVTSPDGITGPATTFGVKVW